MVPPPGFEAEPRYTLRNMSNLLFDPPKQPQLEIAGYVHVALEQGIDTSPEGLTYAVPRELSDLRVGQRVLVPLGRGNRRVTGYVVRRLEHCDLDPGSIKAVAARDAHSISLPDDLIELARWMANYYCCPLGMVFVSMLPAAVKRGTGSARRLHVHLSQAAQSEAAETPVRLTRLQQAVLEAARCEAGAPESAMEMRELADRAGARSIAPVQQLVRKGLLSELHRDVVSAPRPFGAAAHIDTVVPRLSAAQAQAVEHLVGQLDGGFSVHLLHGVTGSGKTEVYLRIIEKLSQAPGLGAVVLVPEIALTPQTVARFVGRFDDVAVLHSGLTDAQRHEQWRSIHDGRKRIVVGARSAIFAPLSALGLIVVDEEHESSYKQDQLPRYHARDVAIKRAQLRGIPVVLGSATPSLESYFNARYAGRYELLSMPQRVAGLQLPKVEVVDMRDERRLRHAQGGKGQKGGVHLLSMRLEDTLRRALDAGGQAMLLLNRRGYANYIACPDHRCGWLMNCDDCDAMMVYHKDMSLPTGGLLRCHHCAAEQMLPARCPLCRAHKPVVFGLGTQRVEEEIIKKLPRVRLERMDSDTMRKGRDYDECLQRFREGEIDVLLGTQMIAKGLDFPNGRVVGVISADTALHLPDFRASERTFQLISQVAGRAGRGEAAGIVVVQTYAPDDQAILLAAAHDYEGFASREVALRREVGLPPASRMARIVVRYRKLAQCREHAERLAAALTQVNEQQLGAALQVRGPAPCPLARIAGYHRQQIELIAPPPEAAAKLQQLMTALRNRHLLRSDAHTAVDVDPVALM